MSQGHFYDWDLSILYFQTIILRYFHVFDMAVSRLWLSHKSFNFGGVLLTRPQLQPSCVFERFGAFPQRNI